MEVIEKLGRRVKKLRKQLGITQEGLAEKAGLSINFIGLFERGKNAPSLKTLQKIASALGVKIEELFRFEKKESADEKAKALRKLVYYLKDKDIEDIKFMSDLIYRFFEKREENVGK